MDYTEMRQALHTCAWPTSHHQDALPLRAFALLHAATEAACSSVEGACFCDRAICHLCVLRLDDKRGAVMEGVDHKRRPLQAVRFWVSNWHRSG